MVIRSFTETLSFRVLFLPLSRIVVPFSLPEQAVGTLLFPAFEASN